MSRLIVEAVGNTINTDGSLNKNIRIIVSVSESDTGSPITGLKEANFKVTNMSGVSNTQNGPFGDTFLKVSERTWDPDDNILSGVYDVIIETTNLGFQSYMPAKLYTFGLQVNAKLPPARREAVTGQTVVAVELFTP